MKSFILGFALGVSLFGVIYCVGWLTITVFRAIGL